MLIEALHNPAVSNRAIEEHARKACMVAHVPERVGASGHSLCRVLGGDLLMYVDLRDVDVAPRLALDGFWELGVTRFMARAFEPGAVVVDVGANVGYYTLLMAKLGARRVHAFEPNPWPSILLEKSALLNGVAERVSVHKTAVWSEDAEIALSMDNPDRWGCVRVTSGETGRVFTARAVPLDALFDVETKVDFVKIDAEGSEPTIWQGMTRIRAQPDVKILMEWAPSMLKDPGAFAEAIVADGFSLRLVLDNGDTRLLKPMEAIKLTGIEMLFLVRS